MRCLDDRSPGDTQSSSWRPWRSSQAGLTSELGIIPCGVRRRCCQAEISIRSLDSVGLTVTCETTEGWFCSSFEHALTHMAPLDSKNLASPSASQNCQK